MGRVAAELPRYRTGATSTSVEPDRWRIGPQVRLCKHTMNELTANRRSMKSTYKNILDLMLPPSDGARACASSLSDCSRFSVYRLPSPSSMFLHHMRVVPTGGSKELKR